MQINQQKIILSPIKTRLYNIFHQTYQIYGEDLASPLKDRDSNLHKEYQQKIFAAICPTKHGF